MKKQLTLLMPLILFGILAIAQKTLKTIHKDILFKTPAYWNTVQDNNLKNAPANIRALLESKNADFQKSGKSLRLGYTGVYNVPLEKLNGFVVPTREVPGLENARPLDGPAPQTCLNITVTEQSPVVDMRDYGVITPVRQQDSCGGCWAFASIAALETANLLVNGGDASALQLSVAQVLACCGTTPGRCNGGIQGDAVGYMTSHYIGTESEFQFSWPGIKNVQCNNFSPSSSTYKASNGGWVTGSVFNPSPSISDLKRCIIRYGSVAASLHTTSNFQAYTSGVYDLRDNSTVFPNHVIQIIGWDDRKQAWLIKNSWGTNWGIGGFGWVEYGSNVIGAYAVWLQALSTNNSPCTVITNAPEIRSTAANPNATYAELATRFPFPQLQRLQNVWSNRTVEVDDPVIGTSDKGHKVQQWAGHTQITFGSDGHNQEWVFMQQGKVDEKPVYRIFNYGFSNYLTDNAGLARAEIGNSSTNQLWFIENTNEAGTYLFKNVYSGKYLQLARLTRDEGTLLVLGPSTGDERQRFRLASTYAGQYLGDKENHTITILPSHATNMAIDLPAGNYADNVSMHVWERINGNKNQAFEIKWDGNAKAYSIFSRQRDGNKNLEIYGFSKENGGRAVLWESVGGENQYWYILPVIREGGKFVILNKLSGKSLDVSGVGRANGTALIQWDFVNNDNQKWQLRGWE